MGLFYRSKKTLLEQGFTHYGKLWGIPVYIGDIESEAIVIETANFIPQWVLDIADIICLNILEHQNRDNPDYKPTFKICVGKPISR